MMQADEAAGRKLQMLVLERRDAKLQHGAFLCACDRTDVVRRDGSRARVGRIGSSGRRRLDLHADKTSAAEALDHWLARKNAADIG